MASCGGCTSEWSGLSMAHCVLCHETFSTAGNFDQHLDSVWKRKQLISVSCKPPGDVGLQQNARGTWKMPDERDLSELHQSRRKND